MENLYTPTLRMTYGYGSWFISLLLPTIFTVVISVDVVVSNVPIDVVVSDVPVDVIGDRSVVTIIVDSGMGIGAVISWPIVRGGPGDVGVVAASRYIAIIAAAEGELQALSTQSANIGSASFSAWFRTLPTAFPTGQAYLLYQRTTATVKAVQRRIVGD